jgi:ABC transporter ATM
VGFSLPPPPPVPPPRLPRAPTPPPLRSVPPPRRREPRLLICDEATSALDTATERGILSSLAELAAGRTSVFVAHRLSTVQGCDRIYVLREGEVAEEGTHAELMARQGGVYAEMWRMQAAQQVGRGWGGFWGGGAEGMAALGRA